MSQRCAWLVIAAAVAALGVAPRGQTPASPEADYAAVLRAYVTGHDAGKAVTPLAAWTPGHFANAVETYLADQLPRATAAAAFHLEVALGVVTQAPALAAQHLDLGHQLIRHLRATLRNVPPMSIEEIVTFAERWYVAAASTLLMVNDSARAGPFIQRGLAVAPRSLELRLMVGIVDDLNALSMNPDDTRGGNARIRVVLSRRQAFLRARNRYADLVKEAPGFVKARIRLGRVLWMLEDFDASQLELEHALDQARDPVHRYLSSMFLGALYERKGDLAAARAAYEAARADAPRSQAATVALGHLEVLAGRPDRAQGLTLELLSAPPVADEWWSFKNGGFEIAALAWVRSRVWQ